MSKAESGLQVQTYYHSGRDYVRVHLIDPSDRKKLPCSWCQIGKGLIPNVRCSGTGNIAELNFIDLFDARGLFLPNVWKASEAPCSKDSRTWEEYLLEKRDSSTEPNDGDLVPAGTYVYTTTAV